jgi:hypothetical protein
MSITDSIRNIIKKLFGADPVTTDADATLLDEQNRRYRDLHGVNLTAIFAGKLAALTVTESTVEIIGDSVRAEALNENVQAVWSKARKWTSVAFGTGGVVLIPYVSGGRLYTDIVPQSSMVINRVNGDEPMAVSILADSTVQKDERYFRYTDYSLDDSGLLTIRQRAANAAGSPVPLSDFSEWALLPEEMTISGCEHLPLAFIKCPVDSRRNEALYGVPITFGCEDLMREIGECLEDVRREYRLKKPIVGMDSTMFDKGPDGKRHLPITGLFMPVTPAGLNNSGKLWDVYDPAIRDSSYYNRLTHLYELLEKQVGTSRGILTEPTTRGATATEIKAGLYDTYAIVELMRTAIEHGLERLAYAMDVLNNAFGLSPMGEYEVSFDWSYSMIESSQESFSQLISAASADAVEPAEVRQFVLPGETLEEARERCAEIRKAKADLSDELLRQAMTAEARRNPNLTDDDEG